jgi:ribose transport system permease protein
LALRARLREAKALRVATPCREWVPAGLRPVEPRHYVVYVAFLLIFVFFAVALRDDGFLTQTNLLNIVRQTTPVSVMAVAVVFVLSAREIDLSLGAVVSLSALVTADILQSHSAVLAVAAGLGVGLGIGAVNGLFVTLLRLPSFLVTLASMGLVAGLARTITNLESVAVENESFINIFGSGNVGPIPSLALWALGAVALGQFVFRHKRFGAHVVATGDNVGAARATGIRVDRVKFAVLVLSGASAAVAGILYTGRLQGAGYTLGEQDLLTVIAAVVIGGSRLSGGEGSGIGGLLGSLSLGRVTNGLILWGLSSSEQLVAQGVVLLLAISITLREPKAE